MEVRVVREVFVKVGELVERVVVEAIIDVHSRIPGGGRTAGPH